MIANCVNVVLTQREILTKITDTPKCFLPLVRGNLYIPREHHDNKAAVSQAVEP